MRLIYLLVLAITTASCGFFGETENRPPRISFGEFFVSDVTDTFEVTMRAGGADPDGNLERLDCTGDVAYSGPSPVDTTAFFPLDDTGQQIVSECVATDTDGLVSTAVPMFLTLPDTTTAEESSAP